MGNTTHNALAAHGGVPVAQGTVNRAMTGGVAVFDPSQNAYYRIGAKYEQAPGADHVERALLRGVIGHFGTPDQIPNGARIVVVCNWSPCRDCVANAIPQFMALVAGRNIQVKFRYRHIYTGELFATAWPASARQAHAWNTDPEALEAYAALSHHYGRVLLYRSRLIPMPERGEAMRAIDEISRPALFIGGIAEHSGSTVEDTYELQLVNM